MHPAGFFGEGERTKEHGSVTETSAGPNAMIVQQMIEILVDGGHVVGELREPGQEKRKACQIPTGMTGCTVPVANTPGMLSIPEISLCYLFLARGYDSPFLFHIKPCMKPPMGAAGATDENP